MCLCDRCDECVLCVLGSAGKVIIVKLLAGNTMTGRMHRDVNAQGCEMLNMID